MYKISFILIFNIVYMFAHAEPTTVSLKDAIERAKSYSPDIKLQQQQIKKIELEKRSVLGEALPNISTSYTVNNFIDTPVISGFSLNSKYEKTFDFTVRQALFRFGAITSGLAAAKIALGTAELQKTLVERDVVYATKVAYYSSLLAAKQLEISNTALQNAKQNLNLLQNYFSSGRPPQGDLIRLQADIAARKSQLEEAKFNQELAHTQLRTLMGLNNATSILLTDEFDTDFIPIDREVLRRDLQENQPQLRALKKQIEYQEEVSNIQKARTLPKIDAIYNVSSSDRSDTEIFEQDSNVSSSLVGVTLTWEIWNGGTNRANYNKAVVDKNLAEIVLSQKKINFYHNLTLK
ncbi:MAG: TolC family protein [Bdellovibrionales bacterium]